MNYLFHRNVLKCFYFILFRIYDSRNLDKLGYKQLPSNYEQVYQSNMITFCLSLIQLN